MPQMHSEGSGTQPVHSVLHAVRILEFFASSPEESLSLTDISRGLGIHKTTVYRLLRTLQSAGWVEQSATSGKYRLGSGAILLSAAACAHRTSRELVTEEMERLAEQFQELVVLAAVQNGAGRCVGLVKSKHSLSVMTAVGYSVPLQAGATGKTLLAAQPQAFCDTFLASLPPAQARTLGEQVAEIRQQGFCCSENEVDLGAAAVAVPLRLQGEGLALSISGPIDRLRQLGAAPIRDALQAAVRRLEQKTGNFQAYE